MLEFIGEIILELSMGATKNKRIPKWIRYPILIVIVLLYSFIISGLFLIAMGGFQSGNYLMGSILLIIDLMMIWYLSSFFRRKRG